MAASTLDRLLDRAEDASRKRAVGQASAPSCAYVLQDDGGMRTLAFPLPDDDAGRDALAAVLAMHLDSLGGQVWVLALPTRRRIGRRSWECVLLDGHAHGEEGFVRHFRLLRIERRRGVITALHRKQAESEPPPHVAPLS